MTNKKTEQEAREKMTPPEISVGYNGWYHFEICNPDAGKKEEMFFTNDWSSSGFYRAGELAAGWLHKRGARNYQITNGVVYTMKFSIPEEEADARIKARADDPFWSGEEPTYTLERKTCRELMPEQIEVFRKGLESKLKLLLGEIVPVEGKEALTENPLLPEVMANRYAKELCAYSFSEDSEKDSQIRKRKLAEAMITGRLDLSGGKEIK